RCTCRTPRADRLRGRRRGLGRGGERAQRDLPVRAGAHPRTRRVLAPRRPLHDRPDRGHPDDRVPGDRRAGGRAEAGRGRSAGPGRAGGDGGAAALELRGTLRASFWWTLGLLVVAGAALGPLSAAIGLHRSLPVVVTVAAIAFGLGVPIVWGGLQGAALFVAL